VRNDARGEATVGIIGIGRDIAGGGGLGRFGQAPFGIILIGQRRAAPPGGRAVSRDVAGRIIGNTARRPARRRDGGELVRGRGIGVSRLYGVGGGGGRIDGLRRPVASRVIGPGVGAVIADGGSQAMGRTIGEAPAK
jgi:hypothetical protein